jgi:mannose-6-phosphate isomerase-like protein (cupin superfamily)
VTANDAQGKGTVLFDGDAPNVQVLAEAGVVSTLLWVTDETPARFSAGADRADREIGIPPPDGGSILRIVDFEPEGPDGLSEEAQAWYAKRGAEVGQARHPGMHKTRSIDYALVMSGEIDMLMDDGDLHLTAGDVVVQQGTNHAWANRGTETCRIAFVLIDAEEDEK